MLVAVFAAGGAWHTMASRIEALTRFAEENRVRIVAHDARLASVELRISLADERLAAYMAEAIRQRTELRETLDDIGAQLRADQTTAADIARKLASLEAIVQSLKEQMTRDHGGRKPGT